MHKRMLLTAEDISQLLIPEFARHKDIWNHYNLALLVQLNKTDSKQRPPLRQNPDLQYRDACIMHSHENTQWNFMYSIVPALLYGLSNTFGILPPIVLVQVRSLDVGR
jgi:hypothetical protein